MTASAVEKTTAAQSTSPQGKQASPAKDGKQASPAKTDSPVDNKKEAMNHFVAGKRHLLVRDLNAAVDSFAQACEMLSAEYGEAAYECADAYYYYGKALLDMARAESGVFGNALDGVPEGEDSDNSQTEDPDKMTEEEKDDVEKKVGEALDENFTVLEEKIEERQKRAESTEDETEEEGEDEAAVEGDAKKVEDAEAKEPEKTKEESKEESKEDIGGDAAEAKEGEDMKAQEAEEEEDPSNLQLAWEMLEFAKVAYTNKLANATPEEKKAVEMKICETLLTLGEVSVENETYDQAVTDITECLNKRKELHAADSRRVAETYYNLGVALGHNVKFDEAVVALEDAIKVLKLRMENLKNKTESSDESKVDDAFYSRDGEISELESLIPEIQEKIQDTKDMKVQSENDQEQTGFKNGEGSAPAKPISSISVKRKAEGSETVSPKKAHVATNGTAESK